jgi:hypothetical protein
MPDLVDLENKVRYNDSIAGILFINRTTRRARCIRAS